MTTLRPGRVAERPPARARRPVATPAPRDVWRALAAEDPRALVSQTPAWTDALAAAGAGEDASRLYTTAGGNRIVLPMLRRRGAGPAAVRPRASMPPAWGMGGVLAEREPDEADMAEVIADLAAGRALTTRIRPDPLQAGLWAGAAAAGATALPGTAHVLDLEGGEERVWAGLHKDVRRQVRKAERCGVRVERAGGARLIPVYERLAALSVRRWAAQQHEPAALARWRARRREPPGRWARVAEALGEACTVWVASHEGRAAAAFIVLRGANASDTRGAMDKELAARTCAGAALQWAAIRDACRAGCRWYHLGESAPGSPLARWKERFGARPVPYATLRFERVPVARADALARGAVKRMIGFRDA